MARPSDQPDGIEAPKPTRGRVARRREQRRDEILARAASLIAKHGVEGLTAARLAEAVGLTPGALYRYFPGMSAVVAGVLGDILARVAQRHTRALAALGLAPAVPRAIAALYLESMVHAELAREAPERFGLLAVAIADPRELVGEERAVAVRGATFDLLQRSASAFSAARSCGALRDDPPTVPDGDLDHERAFAWTFAGHGLLTTRKLARRAGQEALVDHLHQRLRHDLLRAWGADEGPIAAGRRLAQDTWATIGPLENTP